MKRLSVSQAVNPRIARLQKRLNRLVRQSNIVAPDPSTVRIFLSEFESGRRRGEDGWSRELESESNEKLAEAVASLKDLAMRMDQYVTGSGLMINENRLANKMSSICSALFYRAGILRGLKQSG